WGYCNEFNALTRKFLTRPFAFRKSGSRNIAWSVLFYLAMRTSGFILAIALMGPVCAVAAQPSVAVERRQRAASALHDGILLLHASSTLDLASDGFRQDPFFYYFTELENTVGAVLASDARSGESWLFLPANPPFLKRGLQPEAEPGAEAAKLLGIEHVVDWSEMENLFSGHAAQ